MKRYLLLLAIAFVIWNRACAYRVELESFGSRSDRTHNPGMVELDDLSEIERLESLGVRILHRRGMLALAYFPIDFRDHGTRSCGAEIIERPPRVSASLDCARARGADTMQAGSGLPQGYTGRGVVVGLCDIGIDTRHPAFLTPDGTASRISAVYEYKEAYGSRRVMTSPGEIYRWRTDTIDHRHATHVAGILAGTPAGNPWYGVATDAEIVVSTSMLSDVGLLAGAEDIVAYARSVGKPAVVNLSMGSCLGPHDGSSFFCRYLDLIGEEALVVLSAGNHGLSDMSIRHIFDTDADPLRFRLSNTAWDNVHIRGALQAWCDGPDPRLSFSLRVMDTRSWTKAWDSPLYMDASNPSSPAAASWQISSDPMSPAYDAGWARYFSGWMRAVQYIDPANSRRCLEFSYDYTAREIKPEEGWGAHHTALCIYGDAGTGLTVVCDGQSSLLRQYGSGPAPGPGFSFSDLATGRNTISVGMYNTRTQGPSVESGTAEYGLEVGAVNPNSSYATLADGRVMPLTVAPGAVVISAASAPYQEALEEGDSGELAAVCTTPYGMEAIYTPGTGTSMSAPYVAGCLAAWLEADPTLDISRVQAIIEETNRPADLHPEDPRNGRGWFDPVAGLRHILETNSISGTTLSGGNPLRLSGPRIHVTLPVASDLTVYTPDGRQTAHISLPAGFSEVDTRTLGLPPGLYIASAGGGSVKFRR